MIRNTYFMLASSIVVILVLTSVTIWDVYLITDNYSNANRVTLVNWQAINKSERHPFLENATITVRLYYPGNSLFQELWLRRMRENSKAFSQWKDDVIRNTSNIIEPLLRNFDANRTTPLALDERYAAAFLFESVDDFDHNVVLETGAGNTIENETLAEYKYLDEVLNDSSKLFQLRQSVWSTLEKYIVSTHFHSSNGITMTSVQRDWAVADVRLGGLIPPLANSEYLEVAQIPHDQWETFANVTGIAGFGGNYDVDITPRNPQQLIITVTNQGVFERRATTPECEDVSVEVSDWEAYHNDEEPCRKRMIVDNIADTCRCVPFAYYRRSEPKYSTICTPSILKRCAADLTANGKIFQQRLNCAPSCVKVRNQYSYSLNTIPEPKCKPTPKNDGLCTQLYVIVRCADIGYLTYVEIPQTTPTQFIGQVGGDIGLYTGLSLLTISVWQMFTMALEIFRKRRFQRQNGGDGSIFKLLLEELRIVVESNEKWNPKSSSIATMTTVIDVRPAEGSYSKMGASSMRSAAAMQMRSGRHPVDNEPIMAIQTRMSILEKRFDRFESLLLSATGAKKNVAIGGSDNPDMVVDDFC